MRASVFSPLWYRVTSLRPYLPVDVRVQRQPYRDQIWVLLISGTTGRQFRINDQAYQFIGRCDGRHSVQQVWDALMEQLGDAAPTQDEIIQLLAQLDEQGLLAYEVSPDIDRLIARRDDRDRKRLRGFVNPLAFRIPLGDPSRLLVRFDGWARLVFHPLAFWLWAVVVALAAASAVSNWSALSAHALAYMDTPRYLFLAWMSFPFIKAFHELGHALAVRRWGGEVHESGVTLFLLTPAPYVDASAAAGFRSRRQRVIVGAVGIMAELLIASAALCVWLNVEPGLVRDLAFVTMFTASVSTLLFNGNPLLPFDAYYVLCDAMDLPNLATRSKTYWGERIRRVVSGVDSAAGIQPARGERKWLFAYAPMSVAYRLFLCGLIVLWVGSVSPMLGMLVAAYIVVAMMLKPTLAATGRLFSAVPPGARRWRSAAILCGVAGAAFALLALVPMPFYTTAQGIVWLPDQARVRAETDGFVARFLASDGERVEAGQALLVMEDPALIASRGKLASQLEQMAVERFDLLFRDPVRAQDVERQIERAQSDLRRIEQRIAQLVVRSQTTGTLVMPRQQDLPGVYVRQGKTLGYVLDHGQIAVRVAVAEHDGALVREKTNAVEVRLSDAMTERLAAQIVRDVPAASRELPSAALSDRGGGPHVTDPSDKDALRTLEPVVLIDLRLPTRSLERVGGRAWVRFDHGAEPLASQWYRRTRQLFLQHFDPTG